MVLGEAALRFAGNASGGKEGRFEFENAAEILPATTTGEEPETQTLKFLPADGSAGETKEIPVTVRRRYLPIKISNFEVEYGDDFSRDALTRDVTVTAGGYLLPEHLASLNEIIQQYEIQWLLRDGEGNEIPWPATPETDNLASGTIDLRASVGITPETEFPNYNARVERGVWKDRSPYRHRQLAVGQRSMARGSGQHSPRRRCRPRPDGRDLDPYR